MPYRQTRPGERLPHNCIVGQTESFPQRSYLIFEECSQRLHENARYFRAEMEKLGFDLLPGEHPIVPVMLYDPKVAHEFAKRMLQKGVYVVAFCYPVVPKGKDRIRTQISAGHTKEDIDFAVKAFGEVKKEMGL